MVGQGKRVIWWLHPDRFEPELMYLLGHDFVVGEAEIAGLEEARRGAMVSVTTTAGAALSPDGRSFAAVGGIFVGAGAPRR